MTATVFSNPVIETDGYPSIVVRHQQFPADNLPEKAFDLIHSREVFLYAPDRELTLKNVLESLKPGGWVLIEDLDFPAVSSSPSAAVRQVWRGIDQGYF